MCYREVIYLIGKPSLSAFWRFKDIGRGLTYLSATPFSEWKHFDFHSKGRSDFFGVATPYVDKVSES
jgi:hypothetical protein